MLIVNPRRRLVWARYAAAAVLGAIVASAARAQTSAPRPTVRQTLAVNPLALPFGGISAEYERAIGPSGFALGVGGTANFAGRFDLSQSDGEFASIQGKLKYYPAENGLRGFSVGGTAGLAHGRGYGIAPPTDVYYCAPGTSCFVPTVITRPRVTAPTLGAVIDYNWLIGRRRRFLVGIGLGARRVLGSATTREVRGDVLPDGASWWAMVSNAGSQPLTEPPTV